MKVLKKHSREKTREDREADETERTHLRDTLIADCPKFGTGTIRATRTTSG